MPFLPTASPIRVAKGAFVKLFESVQVVPPSVEIATLPASVAQKSLIDAHHFEETVGSWITFVTPPDTAPFRALGSVAERIWIFWVQLVPPSFDMNRPLGVAAKTRSVFPLVVRSMARLSISTPENLPLPSRVQWAPPSVDLRTPCPGRASLPGRPSPVPA